MDPTGKSLIEELQGRNIRMTPQRAIIFEVIENLRGHFTVEEIFREVQRVNPYVSLATVYRTLELLQELKLVNQTNFGRSQTYFALREHGSHHHIVCTACGRIEEFPNDLLDPVRARLAERFCFQADTDHMSIFGICKNCHNKQN